MTMARAVTPTLLLASLLTTIPASAAPANATSASTTPASATPASAVAEAPPHRADGKGRPVIFVHGFNRSADTNCAAAWHNARLVLKQHTWRARSYTFGFYRGDRNCDMHANGTTDTRIQNVGAALARRIYKHFTSKGIAVDIVAHSMGGLVAKAAIQGTNLYGKQSRKWPSRLYVEDVVTLGTPHRGANFTNTCTFTHEQCSDMRVGNTGFLKWVGHRPQSQMGTDYTFVTSTGDNTVSERSATDGHSGPHWVRYEETLDKEVTHSGLSQTGPKPVRAWNATWQNRDGKQHSGKIESPLVHALAALYRHSTF